MKPVNLVLIVALAFAGTAFAQVPASNDTSDGGGNTGMGNGALGGPSATNLTGQHNTAAGGLTLFSNTAGSENTAAGAFALDLNTTGTGNTAFGSRALNSNETGSFNTATGYQALPASLADYDTAVGYLALFKNTTGTQNVASGAGALYANTTGSFNAALGQNALEQNTTASNNTATGYSALSSNTTGSNNIAEGYQAGINLTTGNNNIDIGNVGVAGESNLIRIGTKGTHKGAIVAGISTSTLSGTIAAVYVTNTGRLGVQASSERYKTAIAPMRSNTAKLAELRPVTFHLKTDPHGVLQYGLIAEEVAKVYPELVIRNEAGRVEGVRYDELAPMLLNEMQQQRAQTTEKIDTQAAEIRDLKQRQLRTQQQMAELMALNQATQVALQKLQAKDELVAQR